ncbi:relaxase/mobilization nuclease domain-containing protein [Paraburkholderia silvatlantica]|uniref:MobA/VirD2-like nuclease domain-containing protein n=1 Tax=Paraburkholderia silvatlantica TaxID=321895 RepID=A0ABR6FYF7_9BURK|nr:hypothetical protein [Paraburkholderia silvatlantica]MBB2932466.1 hypothetical protein [Paraburkholderia silvatlantica]PVY22354.1 hypothetical protein C7411_13258 [Paraburkholderia silvatlantica]PXW27869.1 hypothetical protein C7413_13358 [Paraburkholderia silvatlantica]
MIISNFPKPGTARDAVSYVLSNTNWKGEARPNKPEILKGNSDITILAGDLSEELRKTETSSRIVSGTIAFKSGENISKQQMLELIDRFEDTFFGNMKNRVAPLYVLHDEGDKKHIHYIIPKICLESNKSYDPMPPDRGKSTKTADLMKAFSSLENHNLGFSQVERKPLKPSHTKTEHKSKAHREHSNFYASIFKELKSKETFEKACLDLVKSGDVKNRDELITFLKDQGYDFSRIGKDYLSVVNPDGRNIRLKGGIFAEGAAYKEQVKEAIQQVKSFDPQKAAEQINRLVAIRNADNEKRYQINADKPTTSEARQNASQALSRAGSTATPNPSPRTAPGAASPVQTQTRAEPTQVQAQHTNADAKPASGNDAGISMGASAGATAIGGAQMQLSAAIANRNSAKTPSQKAAAEQAVNQALAALARAQAQFEAEQARQPNNTNNRNKI